MTEHVSSEQVMELVGWVREPQDDGTCIWVGPMTKIRIRPLDYIHNLQLVHDDLESRLTDEERRKYVDAIYCFQHPVNDLGYYEIVWLIRNTDAQTCCDVWVAG